MTFILASASPARRALLRHAGLRFQTIPAALDERSAERPLVEAGADAADIALGLAMAKATMVSEMRPADLVLGADQVLSVEGERLDKPADMEEARRQLLRLSGTTHELHAAAAFARAGDILWQHVETVRLSMRPLTPAIIGRYLAAVGEAALGSVGAYQIEGRGIQLFEHIEGDLFAVMGLPLLPVLAHLRAERLVE
jgi:septum formation protein